MKQYHEIGRYKHQGDWVIVAAECYHPHKAQPVSECAHLYFGRTKKTAKKKFGKGADLYDAIHQLEGSTFNLSAMRMLVKMFTAYFERERPQYVMFGAYGQEEEHDKRIKLYSRVVSSCGYTFIKKVSSTWGDNNYYYKRDLK